VKERKINGTNKCRGKQRRNKTETDKRDIGLPNISDTGPSKLKNADICVSLSTSHCTTPSLTAGHNSNNRKPTLTKKQNHNKGSDEVYCSHTENEWTDDRDGRRGSS
jgi:hypothetical protein